MDSDKFMKIHLLIPLCLSLLMAPSAKAAVTDPVALHYNSFVMDLHTDTLLLVEALGYDFGKRHWPPLGFMPWMGHVDIPRAREGGLKAMFLGLVANPYWGDGPTQIRHTLQVAYKEILNRYPDRIELAWHADDLTRITNEGKIAVQFLLEGAHGVGPNIAFLDELYLAGVRVLGLAHFTSNIYAASSADENARNPSLTLKGKALVRRMNDLGMAVDLAHVHPQSFKDAIAISRAPVIVSHTGLDKFKQSFRNLQDWQIKAVAKTGGVIGIMFAPVWLGSNMYPPLSRVVEEMAYIKKLVGSRYIAIGSDFDGFIWLPRGMWDVTDLPKLTVEMAKANFTADEIRGILGGNILRVLKKIEARATVHLPPPAHGWHPTK